MAQTHISFRPDETSQEALALLTKHYGSTSDVLRRGIQLAALELQYKQACASFIADLEAEGVPDPDTETQERLDRMFS